MPPSNLPLSDYPNWKRLLAGRSLPAAVVDLDRLEANANSLLSRAGGLPIRIASKSLRCRPLLQHILDFHPSFRGLMCFTAPEALWLNEQGMDDLLVAYPTTVATHIERVCDRLRGGHRIILTVDCPEHVSQIAATARQADVVVPLSIEIDLSLRLPGLNFGVWRSPVRDADALIKLAQLIENNPNLRLAGIMGYEAQLAGVPDAAAGAWLRNRVVRLLKRLSMRTLAKRRADMLFRLAQADIPLDFVNAGGTGSLEFSSSAKGVTEVTAGSGFYNPLLFDGYAGFDHQPAAFFALPVSRKPQAGIVTCLGGGYVASGAPGADRLPRPWLPHGATLTALEAAGEVQTPVLYSGPIQLGMGDPVVFRHAKAGELCERFNSLLLVSDGEINEEVLTYRGEGQCFL